MCGRFALYDYSKSEFKISDNLIGRNFNISPSSKVLIIDDNNEFKLVKWTFKVPWTEKLNVINARSETLETKKIFHKARRCIFIANGYFEWLKKEKLKIPYYHTFKDKMMYFGGIFNDHGACIVTRKSYPMKVDLHHRQPVILRHIDFESWFSLEHDYTCKHSQNMDIYEVTKEVNYSKNNSPKNIKKLEK